MPLLQLPKHAQHTAHSGFPDAHIMHPVDPQFKLEALVPSTHVQFAEPAARLAPTQKLDLQRHMGHHPSPLAINHGTRQHARALRYHTSNTRECQTGNGPRADTGQRDDGQRQESP